jgi:hypothetical protein
MRLGQDPVITMARDQELQGGLSDQIMVLEGALNGDLDIRPGAIIGGFGLLSAAAIPCRFGQARRIAQWAALGGIVWSWVEARRPV